MSYPETSSNFTSTGAITSFSSTIPGIGALSGKAFKRFGSAVVNGVDAILIRRRLAQIETTFGQRLDTSTDAITLKSLYNDLLELSRPVYSLSIRTRAFRLIMGKIGAMDVEYLAAAVATCPLSASYDLLKAMILSLRLEGGTSLDQIDASDAGSARLEAYYAAGLDAYKSHLPYASSQQLSRMTLCMAFLLYIGLTVSLSRSPAISRLAIELDLIIFITDNYPGIVESKYQYPWLKHLLSARMVLSVLLDKLDPVKDKASINRLQELLAIHPPSFIRPIFLPMTKGLLLPSIRSNIAYLQRPVKKTHAQKRILLLGSGESGKTTLKKQLMKACRPHTETFTDSERAQYIEPIVRNALYPFQQAIDGATKNEDWRGDTVTRDNIRHYWSAFERYLRPVARVSSDLFDLKNILESRIYSQRFPDFNDYFLDSLPRILSEGYLPSDEDIVRCYIRTLGIHSETINIRGNSMTLLDFGGQRSERKKWKYGFQDAELVIFVASLSDYNEVLNEDKTVNRMQDSLALFESIINSRRLDDIPVILFLNKTDLFAQKLRIVPLKDYFPDYSGGDDYSSGCQFVIDKFLERNRRPYGGWITRVYLTSFIDDLRVEYIMNEIYSTYMDPFRGPTTVD